MEDEEFESEEKDTDLGFPMDDDEDMLDEAEDILDDDDDLFLGSDPLDEDL